MEIRIDTANDSPLELRAARALIDVLLGSTAVKAAPSPDVDADEPATDGHPTPKTDPDSIGNLDSAGTPWDERIHASTKTTNKDGTWTRRRNTPDDVFASVMAELSGTPAPTTPPAPEPTAAEAFTPPPAVVIPPVPSTAPTAAPAPVPAPAATTAAPAAVEIMKRVTAAQGKGRFDAAALAEVNAACNFATLADLFRASDDVRATFSAILASRGV